MEQIVVNGVFIGKVEETWGGLVSAIDKLPVEQEFWLGHDGLPGDEQADIRHHGGLERALHHYPAEHYRYWRKRHPLNRWQLPAFGENISTYGITEARSVSATSSIGAMPCWKSASRVRPAIARASAGIFPSCPTNCRAAAAAAGSIGSCAAAW